mmetsp:Transcript_78211/g.135641  ORF Transcript_78211/g.135641 Transcript_78211/m.135641 type:complete len:431 (+) Transcript_78211:55-1347(+)
MGNACQASQPKVPDPVSCEETTQLHLRKQCKPDLVDCLLNQDNICCLDDESMEASEYRKLEADTGALESSRYLVDIDHITSPLSATSLHHSSRGALEMISSRASSYQAPADQDPPRVLKRSGQVCRSNIVFGTPPAAPTFARDEEEKENLPTVPKVAPKLWPSLKRALSSRRCAHVNVHLYDLSDAFAQLNSVALDLLGYGGALHVGVEVFGVEWSYGTGGVSVSMPKSNRFYAYRQTLSMGRTTLSHDDVESIVIDMHREWSGSEYDLFSKNCGTFCNTFCMRLGVGSLPSWVTRLAEDGAKSQTVRRLADMMMRNGLIGDAPSSTQTTPQVSQATSRVESLAGSPQVPRENTSEGALSLLSSPHQEDLLEEFVPGVDRNLLMRSYSASFSTCSSPARKSTPIRSLERQLIPSPVRRMRRAVAAAAGGG